MGESLRLPAGRRLVLVDVENIVGGGVLHAAVAEESVRLVDEVLPRREDDQVVVGASHASALESGLAWGKGARLVVRSGQDGADLALLDVLQTEHVEDRFDEVVVVSGDGIFTDAIARLGDAGLLVTVVAHPYNCARRLKFAAAHTIYLHTQHTGYGVAA